MSGFKFIRFFHEIRKDDVDIVGGKGANLGEMTNLGLDVPPGFCVTSAGYDAFIEYAGLEEKVRFLMEDLDVDDVDMLTAASDDIRRSIEEAESIPRSKKKSYWLIKNSAAPSI